MKHFLSILFLVLCLASCNSHSEHWNTLSQVESYIEERPDSALVVLEQIDLSELSGKEEKAKHALLYSMALDKNFVDKTDFEVLQPAIDYYEDNGSATDKLRTYYYQGRIYENQNEHDKAMQCFVLALSEGLSSDDILTKARLPFLMPFWGYMRVQKAVKNSLKESEQATQKELTVLKNELESFCKNSIPLINH